MAEPLAKVVFFSRPFPRSAGRLARESVTFDGRDPAAFDRTIAGADLVIEVEQNDGASRFEWFAAAAPCPSAVWLIDTHLEEARHRAILGCYTHVFVAIRAHADALSALHPNVRWLPLCNTKPPLEAPVEPSVDVGFVGNEFAGHHERTRLLDRLQARLGSRLLRGQVHDPAAYVRTLASCRIAFNRSVHGTDTNYRIFEAMAAGAFVLTDRTPDAAALFRDGEQLAFYDGDDDALVQVERWLQDAPGRARVARAGQAEVLARHQWADRLTTIVNASLGTSFSRDDV